MSLTSYVSAFLKPLRKRATMSVLAYRVRARHPTLNASPTSIGHRRRPRRQGNSAAG